MKDELWSIKLASKQSTFFFNNFIEKQAVNMMPAKCIQSRVCHVTFMADAGSHLQSESNRMLTAGDLTATGVTVTSNFWMLHTEPLMELIPFNHPALLVRDSGMSS